MTDVRTRLESLRDEFSRGQRRLAELERERQDTRDTLLRISGAIQVLEELMPAMDGEAEAVAESR